MGLSRERRAAIVTLGATLTMLAASFAFASILLERTSRPVPPRPVGQGRAFEPMRADLRLGDGRVLPSRQLERGRRAYLTYCVACHGADGDGKGVSARGLSPPARDFTRGEFKFAAVPAGRLPNDADLARTIRDGLHGTSMLPGKDIGAGTIDDLVQYVKVFSPRWVERRPGEAIVPGPDRWADARGADAVARGRKLYHALAQCASCHPAYASPEEVRAASLEMLGRETPLRADARFPVAKESVWGTLVWPPDFRRDALRTGDTLPDLYRAIAAGVGGTAMPTWKDAIPDDDLWALAHYVRSLREERRP